MHRNELGWLKWHMENVAVLLKGLWFEFYQPFYKMFLTSIKKEIQVLCLFYNIHNDNLKTYVFTRFHKIAIKSIVHDILFSIFTSCDLKNCKLY